MINSEAKNMEGRKGMIDEGMKVTDSRVTLQKETVYVVVMGCECDGCECTVG